jgi:hypothetical protein
MINSIGKIRARTVQQNLSGEGAAAMSKRLVMLSESKGCTGPYGGTEISGRK